MKNKNLPNIKNKKAEDAEIIEKRARFILKHLGFKSFDELKGKKVLEIGSGDAEFGIVAKQNGVDIVCSDVHENLQKRGLELGLDYRLINALQMPLEDNSFDLVLSHGSVPGIWRNKSLVIATLEEVKRILKKNGEFRFGPTCMSAGASDISVEEVEEIRQLPESQRKEKRREKALKVLKSYDPNITETLVSSKPIIPLVYYIMKK